MPSPADERARLTRRAQRYDRYQQVVALDAQGFKLAEIVYRTGVSRRTIQRWLQEGTFPEMRRRRKRRSIFDSYAAYVLKRWGEGHRNGLQLYQEIKEQGFSGTHQTVYRFLRRLRQQLPLAQAVEAPPTPVQDVVAKEAVWLFVRNPASLDETEQRTLAAICQVSDTAKTLYQLVQEFRQMLHHREGEKLDEWLTKVRASQIRELQSFVSGVERDKAAVVAGLTLPQNNGLGDRKSEQAEADQKDGIRQSGICTVAPACATRSVRRSESASFPWTPGFDGEKSLVSSRENYCLLRPRQQAAHSTNSSTVALPLTSIVGSCKAAACLATSSVWSASRASKLVRAVSGSLVRPAMLHNDPRREKAVRLHSGVGINHTA